MDDESLWRAYAWPERCLRANFVMTVDGHVQGSDGLSGTLSDPEDRRIFHMQRAGCDAVLVGAGTVRAENYGPIEVKPEWAGYRGDRPAPQLIIVSSSGNVPHIDGSLVVDGSDLAGLRQRFPRILCEGGPHLFAALLEQHLVDQLALTVAGEIGGTGELVPGNGTSEAAPLHVHAQGGSLFTLWDLT